MLIGTKHDPHVTEWMDIAIADFIFNNGLPISLVECTKYNKLIQPARHIPPKYTPPYKKKVAGPLLDNIYQSTYNEQIRLLLKESKVFGIALFGNGVTIQKVPMMIFVAKGRHCFARSAHARDNGTVRVNALTGPWLRSCGLITGS